MKLMDFLKLPEADRIQDINDALTAAVHKEIIQKKIFLKKLYNDFYLEFKESLLTVPEGYLVELGSGSGFIKDIIPNVITADVFSAANIDKVFSATKMPFDSNSVSAFFLQNVLHHIGDPRTFFKEVNRCLMNNGKIIMIEPWNSLWGGFIWNFHHEDFDTNAAWENTNEGRLSAANGALPWIIFVRDRKIFESEYPNLKIKRLNPHTPFRYLISGGLSIKQLLPDYTYNLVKLIETILSPLNKYLGMFITIELEKTNDNH